MAASDFVFVYDNFLPKWLYEKSITEICNDKFPWMYPAVGIQGETNPYRSCFGSNLIKQNGDNHTYISPCVNYMWSFFEHEYKELWPEPSIIRLRANMYAPGQFTSRHHDDDRENAWALLYYLTDSDGGTEIEGNEYEHKPNRAILFPADMMHQARPCTSPARITLNWNFYSVFDWDVHKAKIADK